MPCIKKKAGCLIEGVQVGKNELTLMEDIPHLPTLGHLAGFDDDCEDAHFGVWSSSEKVS